MSPQEIVAHIKKLFDPTTSPGTAFDALFAMRMARVEYPEVFNAIVKLGSALDESEEQLGLRLPKTLEFECPKCGIARERQDYCQNPSCPDARQPRAAELPQFKNPVFTFGKYKGKAILDVAGRDPSYIQWMQSDQADKVAPFWKEQAKLAQFVAAAKAPHYHDTDATGYFDR